MGVSIQIKRKSYTSIPNSILWDKKLSMKARFLLCFCLSLKEDWKYSIAGLASAIGSGVDAIKSGLTELEQAGYLIREKGRNELGQMNCIYFIYDEPQAVEKAETADEESQTGKTAAENPEWKTRSGKTAAENPTLLNTINKNNKLNINNRESNNTLDKGGTTSHSPKNNIPDFDREIDVQEQEEYFERFWEAYPRKVKKPVAKIEWRKLPMEVSLYERILTALEKHKQTKQWQDENFIPYPESFLQDERWEDELPEEQQADSDPWEAAMQAYGGGGNAD